MKNNLSRFILIVADIFIIYVSIFLAYYTRSTFDHLFDISLNDSLIYYTDNTIVYIFVIFTFYYEGIYIKRYDFWHESYKVIKSLVLSFLLIITFLAFAKNIDSYSRSIIILTFLYLLFLVPLIKNILKKLLFKIGLWKREAKIYGNDPFLQYEIFSNPYLGYVESTKDNVKTVFINSSMLSVQDLKNQIDCEIRTSHEVIFVPIINDYNITQSDVYELSTSRTNLIVFKNRLKSKYRIVLQNIFNYFLAILLLPLLLPTIAIFAFFIKLESPGAIFFVHNRIGKGGRTIPTLKFRSMYNDAQERLEKLLYEDENLRKEWESDFKLKNDPRITKIGAFLRKTSLDELPQIFNVLLGQMNFVGPRPVLKQELDMYYKEDSDYYYMVKPGITGLWQVSGRSDTDYDFRVATDKWYVANWSLWLDMIILLKTVKVVLFREGAY